ncbi:hypothetical protein Mapa_016631 [Marchantia paleacea]|nr:hypothetical protein Mapa_016631 [Marchantia paleacea]
MVPCGENVPDTHPRARASLVDQWRAPAGWLFRHKMFASHDERKCWMHIMTGSLL